MPAELVLKALSVYKDTVGRSESGISWTSDQVTYPADLKGQLLSDDVFSKSGQVLVISKSGGLNGLYAGDNIPFAVHGDFRAYDQVIENDPASIVMPVMANVYVSYEPSLSEKATLTEVEVHFTALDTIFGKAEDPRIRYVCEGHYDPAGPGDIRFAVVVEVDQNANVYLVENRSGPDVSLTDNSPNGVYLTVADD